MRKNALDQMAGRSKVDVAKKAGKNIALMGAAGVTGMAAEEYFVPEAKGVAVPVSLISFPFTLPAAPAFQAYFFDLNNDGYGDISISNFFFSAGPALCREHAVIGFRPYGPGAGGIVV